jgi:heat shock protein HslJ
MYCDIICDMTIIKTIILFFVIILLGFGIYYGIKIDDTVKEKMTKTEQEEIQDLNQDSEPETKDTKFSEDDAFPNQPNKVKDKLMDIEWFWIETVRGEITGLNPQRIKPQKINTFSLTFTSDGNLIGKTDCNNFGGEYMLTDNKVKFGNFMSTLMYCENSQEQEFMAMIQNGTLKIDEDSLQLIADDFIVFLKQN